MTTKTQPVYRLQNAAAVIAYYKAAMAARETKAAKAAEKAKS